jgi:cell division protein FtsB
MEILPLAIIAVLAVAVLLTLAAAFTIHYVWKRRAQIVEALVVTLNTDAEAMATKLKALQAEVEFWKARAPAVNLGPPANGAASTAPAPAPQPSPAAAAGGSST